MQRKFRTAAAAVCAAAFSLTAGFSVSAALPAVDFVTPLYEDYQPVSEDVLALTGPIFNEFTVQIYQHSPERANLLLFENTFFQEEAQPFYYHLEPGDYTVIISAPKVPLGPETAVLQQDITVENSDYSGGAFSQTLIRIATGLETAAEDADAEPTVTEETAPFSSETVNGKLYHAVFYQYARLRGDFDGNEFVTSEDAQSVLEDYVRSMAQLPAEKPLTAAQKAACDLDGDGELTTADAQEILEIFVSSQISPE